MPKSKPLYGTSKDAYFRRLLRTEPGIGAAASERILRRLSAEVVQVRLREGAPDAPATPAAESVAPPSIPTAAEVIVATGGTAPAEPGFDPYSPNIIVLVRTGGRERALAALAGIERVEQLRLLAREQQLSIDDAVNGLADIRAAIVAAAERRIANRRAAAG